MSKETVSFDLDLSTEVYTFLTGHTPSEPPPAPPSHQMKCALDNGLVVTYEECFIEKIATADPTEKHVNYSVSAKPGSRIIVDAPATGVRAIYLVPEEGVWEWGTSDSDSSTSV